MATNTPLTAGAYIRTLKILHIAFLMGQLFFCGVAFYLINGQKIPAMVIDLSILNIAMPVMAVAAVAASVFIFRKRLDAARDAATLDEKLSGYRSAIILKFALLEFPALLAITVYILTASIPIIVVAGLLIAWFAMQHPTRAKMMDELGVDDIAMMEWERK